MSEYDGSDQVDVPDRVRTGVPAVDEVVESVEGLRERPVDEHAAVFEAAQERLRRALDATDQPS